MGVYRKKLTKTFDSHVLKVVFIKFNFSFFKCFIFVFYL